MVLTVETLSIFFPHFDPVYGWLIWIEQRNSFTNIISIIACISAECKFVFQVNKIGVRKHMFCHLVEITLVNEFLRWRKNKFATRICFTLYGTCVATRGFCFDWTAGSFMLMISAMIRKLLQFSMKTISFKSQ